MNKYTLTMLIRKEGINDDILKTYRDVYNMLEHITDTELRKFIEYYQVDTSNKPLSFSYGQKYYQDLCEYNLDFDFDNFMKYVEFRTKNKKDSSSLEFFKIKYGELGEKLFQEKNSETAINLDHFIKLYGEEAGHEKYKELCKKKKFNSTLEGYIHRYGAIEGLKRYNHWCKSNSGNLTLERMIKLYGVEDGTKRYNNMHEKFKGRYTLEWFTKKYGDKGEEEFNKYWTKKKKSAKNVRNSITKIGTDAYVEWVDDMMSKGRIMNPYKSADEKEKYKRDVWRITYQQPLEKLPNYNKKGHQRYDDTYGIDHKISIVYGFNHGIPPEIIGNIDNLQMLPNSLNSKKCEKCYSVLEYCNHYSSGDTYLKYFDEHKID